MTAAEWIVGISGASGIRLALRFVETLAARSESAAVHVVVSKHALTVAKTELDGRVETPAELLARLDVTDDVRAKIRLHDDAAIAAPISSGSYPAAGMAIVPCSAATLGALASGATRGLLHRAADVTLKQRRPLVLAFRESPLSLVHVENLRTITLAGAIVAPPMPPYYLKDAGPEEWLDHIAHRYLDLLGLAPERDDLRWGMPDPK